jgi:NET1-associated nuclear protein 1 (U3 small nucleolar RNA-associated protein 17)
VTCLEFSSGDLESPIVATAGLDRIIRIWSLEASEEIENPKKVWMHIEQLTYKNLPVRSICFSRDSSLIAAGVGNVLCVWDTINFKLKCALSAPAHYDGSTNRVIISLPSNKKSNGRQITVANLIEKRQKLLKMMKSIIDDGNSSLINDITQEKTRYFRNKSENVVDHKSLDNKEKKLIFTHILGNSNLNFNEKLQIFHKLNIYYKISNRVEEEVIDFISRQAIEETQLYKGLHKGLNEMKSDDKYKLLWRFKTWRNLDLKRSRKIVTVRKLLKKSTNQNARVDQENEEPFLPIKNLTHITNTLFCSEDLSHITVVTTTSRILIWNLLTLKLEGSYKMHTKFITIDPLTNLIAVFTKYNELYVIQPSPAMTIFHRKNLPDIHGAIWVPHDKPRPQAVAVNWQAISKLLFLTEYQEICALSANAQEEDDDVIEIPYFEEINQFTASTPFAAMISKKSKSESSRSGGIKTIMANSTGHIKEVSIFDSLNLYSHNVIILFYN